MCCTWHMFQFKTYVVCVIAWKSGCFTWWRLNFHASKSCRNVFCQLPSQYKSVVLCNWGVIQPCYARGSDHNQSGGHERHEINALDNGKLQNAFSDVLCAKILQAIDDWWLPSMFLSDLAPMSPYRLTCIFASMNHYPFISNRIG